MTEYLTSFGEHLQFKKNENDIIMGGFPIEKLIEEQLEKYELDKMKNDLHKMKTWLEIRLNETNDSCKFQFKVHSENLSLGEIIIFNSNDINERIEQSKNVYYKFISFYEISYLNFCIFFSFIINLE